MNAAASFTSWLFFWSKQETFFVFCVPPRHPRWPRSVLPRSFRCDAEPSGPIASLLLLLLIITPLRTGDALFLHGRLMPILQRDVTAGDLCRVLINIADI